MSARARQADNSSVDRSQLAELTDLLRRNADFRRLFGSSVISFLGDWFALVAVSGLVEELTGSEGSTALVFAAEVLPIFLVAPIAGVLADRVDRKRMMIGADLLRIPPALGMILAGTLGQAWLAYLCVALISILAAFFQPVANASIPNVVDEEDLSIAMTGLGSVWGTMLFVGAAIGGVAAATLGRDTSFVLNAVTFLASALMLLRVRTPFSTTRAVGGGARVLFHLGEVWAFVRPRKVTRALMVTKSGVGVGNGIVGLLPIYALTAFEAGDAGVGILLACRGLGALIGPYVGRRFRGDDGRRLILGNGLSILFYALAYMLLPLAGSLWLAAVFVLLAHVGGGNQWVSSTEGLQRTTPDAVRGRVLSLDFGLATLAMGVSALIASGLATTVGVDRATWLLAGVPFVYALGWLAWTRDLWRGETDPLAVGPAEHRTGVDSA